MDRASGGHDRPTPCSGMYPATPPSRPCSRSRTTAAALVAGFRASVGTYIDAPRFIELVGEVPLASSLPLEGRGGHDVGVLSGSNAV